MYHYIPADDPVNNAIGFEVDFAIDRNPDLLQFLWYIPAFWKIAQADAYLLKGVQDSLGAIDPVLRLRREEPDRPCSVVRL